MPFAIPNILMRRHKRVDTSIHNYIYPAIQAQPSDFPSNAYVTEDGLTPYVTEDGLSAYVTEA